MFAERIEGFSLFTPEPDIFLSPHLSVSLSWLFLCLSKVRWTHPLDWRTFREAAFRRGASAGGVSTGAANAPARWL